MKVVIDIPKDEYESIISGDFDTDGYFKMNLRDAFRNGTLLPKDHGRLGDLDEVADNLKTLRDRLMYYRDEYDHGMYDGYDISLDEVMDAPTILKAESDNKNEK